MLSKYMVLRAPDANTEGASSNSSDDNGADSSQQQQDDNQQSQGDSSQQDASDQGDGDGGDSSDNATGDNQDADGQQDSQQGDQQDGQQDQNVGDQNVVVDKAGDEQLPFHKHARFQEVIAEKNAVKQEVERQKPLVEQATAINDFLRTNNITTQEFQSALQYLQALRTDPVAAFKMLKPTYEQLAQFSGEVLPPDLQAKVAAATMSLEDAQELAKARAQTNYSKVREQWQQNGSQQGTQSIIQQSIGLWQNTKMGVDPDLRPGTDLFKMVDDKIRAMPKFTTPEQVMEGCNKAYNEAKEFFKKYAPRKVTPQQRAPLSSRHSASGNKRVFKTAEEVARFIGGGGKPEQVRYE